MTLLYCHLWSCLALPYSPHCHINGKIFEKKKLLKIRCILIFSKTFVWKFLMLRRIQWDTSIILKKCSYELPAFLCQMLMRIEFSGQIFEKCSNIEFYENPSTGSRVAPCGRTDGRTDGLTDTTKLIDVLRSFTKAPKNDQRTTLDIRIILFNVVIFVCDSLL